MSMLKVTDLHVSYGKHEILKGIGFDIPKGQFAALLGLNGSGKTTLLKSISGLLPIRSGICSVNDIPYLSLDERRIARLICYIPQRHSAIMGTPLLDVVLMGFNPYLGIFSSPGKRERSIASEALVRVGLRDLEEFDFGKLSEGQKQLAILARAIAQDGPVMLLDEPSSSLDFVNSHHVLKLVRELVCENERAALITMHDPNLALKWCDRILLLKDGIIFGEIDLHQDTQEHIRHNLSKLYGEIDVLPYKDEYIMIKQ